MARVDIAFVQFAFVQFAFVQLYCLVLLRNGVFSNDLSFSVFHILQFAVEIPSMSGMVL